MSREFPTFETVVTAILLDRKLVLKRPKDALRRARHVLQVAALTIEAIVNEERSEFVDSFDNSVAQEEPELTKAKKGEPTDSFVRMNKADGGNSELHRLLEEHKANKKLVERGYDWHLSRLKEFQRELPDEDKFDLHPPDGAPSDGLLRDAVIIRKESAVKYVEHEIERSKEMSRAYQQKRRASKKSSADSTTISR